MKWERAFSFILGHCRVECLGNSTPSGEALAMPGEDCIWSASCCKARPGQQAQPFLESVPDTSTSSPEHWLLPLSTAIPNTGCDRCHLYLHARLLLWHRRIHLSLNCLEFFLGTREIRSSREIVWTLLYPYRYLVQAPNFPVLLKISRHELSSSLNSLREQNGSSEIMLYWGNVYSIHLKICRLCFSQRYFLFFHQLKLVSC